MCQMIDRITGGAVNRTFQPECDGVDSGIQATENPAVGNDRCAGGTSRRSPPRCMRAETGGVPGFIREVPVALDPLFSCLSRRAWRRHGRQGEAVTRPCRIVPSHAADRSRCLGPVIILSSHAVGQCVDVDYRGNGTPPREFSAHRSCARKPEEQKSPRPVTRVEVG